MAWCGEWDKRGKGDVWCPQWGGKTPNVVRCGTVGAFMHFCSSSEFDRRTHIWTLVDLHCKQDF